MPILQIEVDDFPQPPTDLIETDGVPMESDWHRSAMNLLIEIVAYYLRDRQDYYVGGNMFLYFNEEQVRTRDYRGPDFFLVWGRPRNPSRPYYAVWKEGGKYPDVIIELASPSTIQNDLTEKKDIYARTFRTHEYYVYDPTEGKLVGWRWVDGEYETIDANEKGWLWCDELGLWLGLWNGEFQGKDGKYLRFFDQAGQLSPTRAEAAEAELAQLKSQVASGGKNGNP